MYKKGYPAGNTFEEIFDSLGIPENLLKDEIRILRGEGYSEKGICYAVGRSLEKLLIFKGDNRFKAIFINEVRKYATNWKTYRKQRILNNDR